MFGESLAVNVVVLAVSLGMLYFGAGWLVRGAGLLARAMHIRPIVVGITIIAFATSTPELVVSLTSTLRGVGTIAIGNIVGANVANVGLIIGVSALVRPLVVQRSTWRKEVPIAVAAQVLLFIFCVNGTLQRWEGVVLVAVLLAFVIWMVLTAKERGVLPEKIAKARARPLVNLIQLLVGGAVLVVGGNLLVPAALRVAEAAGVSHLTIGLTVIAFGTTVPELATGIVAARRGEGDIAIGNAIGSIFFNTAFVLGLAAAISPITITPHEFADVIWVKLPVMIVLVLALVPFMRSGFRVTRLEGAILLACYLSFVAYSFWSGQAP